jgi:acetaldehyde dehydrogenase (acetylating)
MAYALLITWRDGKQEYLRDPATRQIDIFATRAAAATRQRTVRETVEWELAAIDVVPAPRRPAAVPGDPA